ncbi:hypothetical protein K2Z84_05525, partial [Candidatus Binatia bacterium]|nr:hypothetical protein [Candidatus Binatia bacterium]
MTVAAPLLADHRAAAAPIAAWPPFARDDDAPAIADQERRVDQPRERLDAAHEPTVVDARRSLVV